LEVLGGEKPEERLIPIGHPGEKSLGGGYHREARMILQESAPRPLLDDIKLTEMGIEVFDEDECRALAEGAEQN
jgi:hypothetical protein